MESYDVVVVGAGHAGCEAALVCSRMGFKTALLNLYLDNIALMACNPAIGGPAKGHLVREIDALGGEMARITDMSTIHLRVLNTSKGPAVRSLRAQCDWRDYHRAIKRVLENTLRLSLRQDLVESIVVDNGKIRGVGGRTGSFYEAKCVILCTGTYLGGLVHIGLDHFPSGPLGQIPAEKLTESIRKTGITVGRLKTGTPARIHLDSIDINSLMEQKSADKPLCFEHFGQPRVYDGFSCWQTRTNSKTHDVIRRSLDRSPLYTGVIAGIGPRYCPSIEDRVVRFPEKDTHIVFLEPTGRDTKEIYMQNLSTSLPFDAQVEMIRTLVGCEKAFIMRPAYAIEYDYCPPLQIYPSLESKIVDGLYFAGQINGTSGYEEAAAQGLMAGINASRKLMGEEPVVLNRDQAYIGVMIDDLVTKGTEEPYRILTSRAEFRLVLRDDNADIRLMSIGRNLGLVCDDKWAKFNSRSNAMQHALSVIKSKRIGASDNINALIAERGGTPIAKGDSCSLEEFLKRPEISWRDIEAINPGLFLDSDIGARIEVEVKYEGYIARQAGIVNRVKKMEDWPVPADFDYSKVQGLLTEARQKLAMVRPVTIGQAARIPGVNPTDINILMIALRRSGHAYN